MTIRAASPLLPVHLSRTGAVGQRDDPVMRIGGIVQEHRLAADVGHQNPGRDHHEIRFAEGQLSVVVERAQSETRGSQRLGHDGRHAAENRDRPAIGLDHQFAEDLVEQETIVHELPPGFQFCPRLAEVLSGPLLARATAVASARASSIKTSKIVVVDGLHVEIPDFLDQFRNHLFGWAQPPGPPMQRIFELRVFFNPQRALSRQVNSSRLSVTTSSKVMCSMAPLSVCWRRKRGLTISYCR